VKFSDIEQAKWPQLRPYLDTCLLPVTGLTGREEPWQATRQLEMLRDLLDLVEIPFKGRVVTYPALHYIHQDTGRQLLSEVCRQLKACGFAYIIIAALDDIGGWAENVEECALFLTDSQLQEYSAEDRQRFVGERVAAIWNASHAPQ